INSYVPTLYSGNYVYENYISDCTAPQSFYFPIDSHTQAYTIYTYGQLVPTGNTLTTPRGMPWGSDGMVNLWSDTSMNTRVDQIIRPCDPGWTDVVADGYCYKFIYQPYTWTQAEQICHAEGAILATVFDGNFETVLEGQAINVDFWIGLNDRDQEGVFVWDQLNGSIPLTSGMFTNWAPGQPTPDPGHVTNCVIQEMQVGAPLGKGWVPVNCNLTKPAVCIKRNYNYNYEPTFDSENDLPKGIWSLGVQTQTGPCYVKVYSQSEIQLYHQFVVNVHDDAGLDGAIKAANDNRMIAHVTHQEASMIGIEGQLQYLHIYKENLTIQDVEIFYQRSTCAFEYISTPFSCPAYNFNAMVTGIDSMGYLYQRIKPIFCMSGPTQYSCQHGGAFNNGRCYCQQYWTGQYCEQAICVNGGFPDASETA
uniref:C-type lectin domain-containing protein n=1 Tax=Plectus sambesii TaxID=2011161 RepID=A0A914V1Y8_9BILA